MMFWITAFLITAIAALWLTRSLWRAKPIDAVGAESEVSIYRDQLKELESDIARGLLSEADAEASRLEVQRRLLRAADTEQNTPASSASQPIVAFGLACVVGACSFAVYAYLGAPGYPDQPRQARLDAAMAAMQNRAAQDEAEKQFGLPTAEADADQIALLAQLKDVLDSGRGNEEGFRLYVSQNLRIGQYREAHQMQARLVALLGDAAKGSDFADLAEYMVFAAGGYVSPEAEDSLVSALKLEPLNPKARYFSGLMAFQNGRPDYTFKLWQALEREAHPDSYWMQDIKERLPIVASLSGDRYEPPLPGPSQEQVAGAEAMSAEDRAAMIEGMVEGLSDRLNDEGGSLDEWLRLIRAYGVLGRTADASATWHKAQEVFAGDDQALARLYTAAQDAEVAN